LKYVAADGGGNVHGNGRTLSANVQGEWKCGLYEACGFRLCYLSAHTLQEDFKFVLCYGSSGFYSEF
jgi:hypothetical protein